MSWNEWRRRLAEGTEPSPERIDRLRDRIRAGTEPTTALLRMAAPEPGDFAVARVQTRLRAGRRQPSRARPLLGGALALAAAAALFTVVPTFTAAPEPSTVALTAASGTLALSDVLGVTPSGEGTAHGAGAAWTIDWQAGALDVAVVPHAGAQVEIRTAEARVRVIGTRFVVTSDAFGTRVDVSEGKVAVACADGGDHEVVGGGTAGCLPVTDAGLLARALAQSQRGDAPADVLATLDRSRGDDRDVSAEILAARIDPLLALGRSDEARAAADRYLQDPTAPRADEIGHVAGRLALAAGDCAAALHHLGGRTDTSPEEAAWLERCATP